MGDEAYDISSKSFQRKGLAAIEYLLFSQNMNHSCETTDVENWNAMDDSDKTLARCHYAELAATDVIAKAETVITSWQDPSALNSGAYLMAASDTELHSRLNAITDAMFYFDTSTKTSKLAVPMGIKRMLAAAVTTIALFVSRVLSLESVKIHSLILSVI